MFQVGEQWYYLSCPDVRSWGGNQMFLVRTAKHNQDWSGGHNNYVHFTKNIVGDIARTFRLEIAPRPTTKKSSITMEQVLAGKTTFKSSQKAANRICFDLIYFFSEKKHSISSSYYKRKLIRSEYQGDKFLYNYHAGTKTATFTFRGKTEK
jgi:hypothetical protein